MTSNLDEALAQLAQKLDVNVTELSAHAIRFVRIEAWAGLVFSLILCATAYGLFHVGQRLKTRDDDEFGQVIAWIIGGVLLLIAMAVCAEAFSVLLEPEGYLIRTLLTH